MRCPGETETLQECAKDYPTFQTSRDAGEEEMNVSCVGRA